MLTRLTVRHFAVAIVLTLGIVTVVSAQTNTPPSAPSVSMEELLAEVRSLRAVAVDDVQRDAGRTEQASRGQDVAVIAGRRGWVDLGTLEH